MWHFFQLIRRIPSSSSMLFIESRASSLGNISSLVIHHSQRAPHKSQIPIRQHRSPASSERAFIPESSYPTISAAMPGAHLLKIARMESHWLARTRRKHVPCRFATDLPFQIFTTASERSLKIFGINVIAQVAACDTERRF
jgi:hypothetical protein